MIQGFIPGPRDFAAYVYKIRYFVYAIALLMLLSFLIGAVFAATMPDETEKIVSLVASQMADIDSDSSFSLMINLFVHNGVICLAMVLLGLALGLIPLLIAFDNGIMIGLVGGAAAGRAGLLFTLAAILPHGIIELPMMALSAAIGLRLGYCVLMTLFRQPGNVLQELKDGVRVFTVWVLPLLLVAAFVESYITTALVYFLTQ
jgi:stage II sporulation protein M